MLIDTFLLIRSFSEGNFFYKDLVGITVIKHIHKSVERLIWLL